MPTTDFATRSLRGVLIGLLVAIQASAAHGQPEESRVLRDSQAPSAETELTRIGIIEQQLENGRDWTFHHSVGELPPDLRALLYRVAGSSVVGPGQSFNTGDIKDHPSDSQHSYTAVAGDVAVIVWYTGTMIGPILHAVVYDRVVRDAVQYVFRSQAPAVAPLGELKGRLLDKNNRFLHWEYLASPAI